MALSASALERQSLNGLWDFRLEEGKSLEDVAMPGFAADAKLPVPGVWDATSHYYNKTGTGCYRTRFTVKDAALNGYLVVDGCGLRSKYWLDGREIGFSKLPWSKLTFETGPLAAGEHVLEAALDNIVDNKKLKLFWNFYDFYPFGGFHHGVALELQRHPEELRRVVVRTRDYKKGLVELEAQYAKDGPADFTADVAFDREPAARVAFRNRRAKLNVPNFRLWSPEHPNLHIVALTAGNQQLTTKFGIRQVATAKSRVTLNGEPVLIKGVNRHESHYEFGPATPVQLMYEDIMNLKDLGGNFIRGAHYAQCEAFLDLCDELGVMVWEESLGWGNKIQQLEDAEFRALQEEQTRLMVRNSINHPCVVVSAFLNEPDSNLPVCKTLVDRLVDVIRAEDTGHLVTFACHRYKADISHAKTDLICVNSYPYWYDYGPVTGTHEEMRANIRKCLDDIAAYFRNTYKDDRPIIMSEIGVKADWGMRDPRGKAQMTEDFQAEYTKTMLETLFAHPEYAGVALWQFTDAKTYTRKTYGVVTRSYGVNTG